MNCYDDDEHECESTNQVARFEDAKEWLEELLYHMYTTGSVLGMEGALDELSGLWDIKLPKSAPVIQKTPKQLFDFVLSQTTKTQPIKRR